MNESTHTTEYEALKKKADEYLEGWKRAKADYLNFKKEVEQQREELAQFATIAMVLDFLPLHTNFKRAVAHIPEDQRGQDWVKGFMAIYKQLNDMLSNMNIKEVPTEHFNPEHHEAVEYKKVDGKTEGEIVDVVEEGYIMHDKIIQPAKVVVASGNNNPERPTDEQGVEESSDQSFENSETTHEGGEN